MYHTYLLSSFQLDFIAPHCSFLIYKPERREEVLMLVDFHFFVQRQVWRFFTYQFVHVGLEHIAFNILMQLLVGLPLEMAEPGWKGTARFSTNGHFQVFKSYTGSCLSTRLELCLGLWAAPFPIHTSVKLSSSCTIVVLNIQIPSSL